jgi:biopolymer transport protein TolQ
MDQSAGGQALQDVMWGVALAATTDDAGLFTQLLSTGGVVLGVLVVLVLLSVGCWFIIGVKATQLARSARESRLAVTAFRDATRLAEFFAMTEGFAPSPARDVFRAGYEELNLILQERGGGGGRPPGDGPSAAPGSPLAAFENIERSLHRVMARSRADMEAYLGFLATVGSAAPFIGLFGTVWGIMNAFADIDASRPILETVTPHIAEALVATAVGLLAAIPAVMAYNWLTSRVHRQMVELEDFATDYLNILRRHFFS